jgi:arabinose-5-phosphate isomerase
MADLYGEAVRVLGIEADWLDRLPGLIRETFAPAVEILAAATGKIIICGMGKSGHVARKIASTMTGTGSPAYFLHPSEGVHGDLGILQRGDAAIVLSKSGETPEIVALLPSFADLGIPVVAMTCSPDSLLAKAADVVLLLPDLPEACPHNLAPTASTTAMMALGDAIAMALLLVRDFSPDDFAMVHPGGTLGRKLLLRVSDLMVGPPLPELPEEAPLADAVAMMTSHRGVCLTTGSDGSLSGIFVYGDLGRLMKNRANILDLSLGDVVVRAPAVCRPEGLAAVAAGKMEEKGITSLVVVDSAGVPAGILYLHDVLRAGVR